METAKQKKAATKQEIINTLRNAKSLLEDATKKARSIQQFALADDLDLYVADLHEQAAKLQKQSEPNIGIASL